MKKVIEIAEKSKAASCKLINVPTQQKNDFLFLLSEQLNKQFEKVLNANAEDLKIAKEQNLSAALTDRLKLTEQRIKNLASSVKDIAALEDPVSQILEDKILNNGLKFKKISVPLGSIVMVYESRPNVTIDAACLCVKSGNSVILKGGKEANLTNIALVEIIHDSLRASDLPLDAALYLSDWSREEIYQLIKQNKFIDLVIPRGSEDLVKAISQNATIPVLSNSKGLCHTFIDSSADIDMALKICDNAKTQRPSVCNAMETLIVHKDIAARFLPRLNELMLSKEVELRGDEESRKICSEFRVATESDWDEEYCDLILAIKVVSSLDQAISHIQKYGSKHSEAIITDSSENKRRFFAEIDAAALYCNASTRFTDGGEFGLGAEIGISTGKLHARGPIGLNELTSYKYIIEGNGQIR